MGGGIGMGNTCKPMAVLFQCMTKFTTNKKKKKKEGSVSIKDIHILNRTILEHNREVITAGVLEGFLENHK